MKTAIGFKKIDNWRILGPNGFVDFDGIKCSEVDSFMEITFHNGSKLQATSDHKLYTPDEDIIELQDLEVGDDCLTDQEGYYLKVSEIEVIEESVLVYTPINVDDGHQYVTHDGLVSKNCAFVPHGIMEELWASVYPVVSSAKGTKVILVSTPNGADGLFYEIYDKAEKRVNNEKNGIVIEKVNEDDEQWVPFKFLWDEVPGRDEQWKATQIESFNGDLSKWNQEFGCVSGDTLVEVKMDDEKHTLSVTDLIFHMEDFEDHDSENYFSNTREMTVRTPDGYVAFSGIFRTAKQQLYKVFLDNGFEITVSGNHGFYTETMDVISARNLKTTDVLQVSNGCTAKPIMVVPTNEQDNLYDLTDVDNDAKSYLTNGIVSHNCEFLGSSHILVRAECISEMEAVTALINKDSKIKTKDYMGARMHVLHEPVAGNSYMIGCDISDGIGGDSTVIKVFDITNPLHIREVAFLRENVMNILNLPYILAVTGLDYNIAPILIESNHEGTIIKLLEQVYEYENVVSTKRDRLGIYSTAAVKVEACLKMKGYLESPHVQVDFFDQQFLTELKSFEKRKSGNKYGYTYGPKNKADDTVLATIWAFYIFNSDIIEYYFDVEFGKYGYMDIPTVCKSFYSESEIESSKEYFKTVVMESHNLLMNGSVESPFDDAEDIPEHRKTGVFNMGEW
jgi:hypothetical protein